MSDQGFRLDYHACREVFAKRLATAERVEIAAITWQEFLLASPPGSAMRGK